MKNASFGLLCLLLAGGCATYTDLQSTEMAVNQNYELMREDYQRLKGSLEGLQMEIERLRAEVDKLKSNSTMATRIQGLETSLDQLNQRLNTTEAARARDKQEIVDSLSGKITKIMSSSAPARPKTSPRRAGGDGYEHVVEAGQTISAIAQAYNVRTTDILEANNITDPTKIRVGQKLFIPAP